MLTYILPVYIGLLLAGGAMGYLKAGSKVSLVTAIVFAVALAVCGYTAIPRGPLLVHLLQALLLVVFVARFAKTRKFMPAGLMVVVTVLALVLGVLLR
jgi:uncharacterized membrane protein (UPF0136 family)